MMKMLHLASLVFVVMFLSAGPLLAQAPTTSGMPGVSVLSGRALAAGLGMGLTIIGAGIGLGRIGAAAMEGMARQPEIAARIQTGMLIIAAMLEGATLASVILSFLVGNGAAPW
jgi:F-type H+-transporting ATPase subunit c